MPQRLRDAAVPESELNDIAAATLGDHMILHAPGPFGETEVRAILRAAW